MILKIRIASLFSVNSINNRMTVQQIFFWHCVNKYECYTYQTLEPCIKSIGNAETPNLSLSLIQEGASKRHKVKPHIRYKIYHYSE